MLATLIQTLASGEPAFVAKRVRRAMVDYTVAAIALSIGFGFLIAAALMVAGERFGYIQACLGFGVGFIAIAGAALIYHRIRSGMAARRRVAETRATQIKTLAGATAIALLPTLLKSRGGLLQLALPALAMAAYAIYKENAPTDDPDGDDES